MKKTTWLITILLTLSMLVSGCAMGAEKPAVRAAFLKGPTGLSAAHLMEENESNNTKNAYTFTLEAAPDVIMPGLITGEIDIAALPTNTIALLHQRTEGEVQLLCASALGVLYLVEKGDSVQSLDDLSGKSIIAAGKGTTVEAVAMQLFPEDAQIEYASEHAEAVAQAIAGNYVLALLPEPFVTSLLAKDDSFRIALDMTTAWEESTGTPLVMTGIAVRRAFYEENPDAVAAFLAEYESSIAFAQENPADAATLAEKYEIMAANIAEPALPRVHMALMTGEEMRSALDAYYDILMETNAELIGGSLPSASLYAGE